jgi:hypothetical protein
MCLMILKYEVIYVTFMDFSNNIIITSIKIIIVIIIITIVIIVANLFSIFGYGA